MWDMWAILLCESEPRPTRQVPAYEVEGPLSPQVRNDLHGRLGEKETQQ